MYNAIIPDELLHPLGIFKERLSQSALFAAMRRVPEAEALAVRQWLDAKGMTFRTGTDRSDRTHRRTNSRTMPDVCCCPANRGRLRVRRDRHSVSAGIERHLPGLGPGRRAAQQRRPTAGEGCWRPARFFTRESFAALQ